MFRNAFCFTGALTCFFKSKTTDEPIAMIASLRERTFHLFPFRKYVTLLFMLCMLYSSQHFMTAFSLRRLESYCTARYMIFSSLVCKFLWSDCIKCNSPYADACCVTHSTAHTRGPLAVAPTSLFWVEI